MERDVVGVELVAYMVVPVAVVAVGWWLWWRRRFA
jgi:hypothetical protein